MVPLTLKGGSIYSSMTEQTIIRAERRAKTIDLLGGECVKCGSIEHLEFDHKKRDRVNYANCLSQMWNLAWDRILVELNKCQLLCHDCHVVKSHEERGHDVNHSHGSVSTYTNRRCRCDKCKAAQTVYMQQYRIGATV